MSISKTFSEKIAFRRPYPFTFPLSLQKPGLNSMRIVYHISFWMVFYLFNALLEGSYLDNYAYSFYASLVRLPLQIALAYFNLYYLLPKFVLTKKYNLYFLSLLVVMALVLLTKRIIIFEFVYPATCPVTYEKEARITFFNFFLMLNSEIYLIGITSAIKLSIDWVKNNQLTKALEKEKLEAELGLLQAQIQPHFFFNTLNNLYALTLTKSDQAPGIVQKLSALMSYLLYDCEQSLVSLQEEIKLIYNYIDLEKLRYGKRLKLKFDIEGNCSGKTIPPYILLPFIENAFKHAQSQLDNVAIKISIQVKEGDLILNVANPIIDKDKNQLQTKGGIGLKNVKKRLYLLYEKDFTLEVKSLRKEFLIHLRIPLNA